MDNVDWQQLQLIFERVVELPLSQRDEFLDQACGTNERLRREIEALILADSQENSGLQKPLLSLEVKNIDQNLIDTVIDDWKVIKVIGVGGMGSVFLAERYGGHFQQKVALKIVKKGMDTASVLQRFHQERQILARLNHKNIATILDGGVTTDGRPYFAMEYVNGLPIDQYCNKNRLNIILRVQLFQKVCDAVHYAHKNLIVHRDLKPSNIIVTPSGELKLLDFGIAKVLDDSNNSQLTRTGMQLHTPAYASPEQLTNDVITTASDIYALGILFYELLTGRKPFEVNRSQNEFRKLVLTGQPTKPSEAVTEIHFHQKNETPETISSQRGVKVEGLKRSLMGDLDTICLMAMHREPERRYTSASEFAADIKRHLDGRPVVARPESTIYRFHKFIRRNQISVFIASVAVLSIVFLSIFYTVQLKHQRDIAIGERQKSDEVVRFVTGLFEFSEPSRRLGQDISTKDLLDEGANRIQFELVDQPLIQQTLRQVLGEVYYKIGEEKKALTLLNNALTKQVELLGHNHLDVARTKLALAMVYQDVGEYDRTEPLLLQALETRKTLLNNAHFDVVEAMSAFAYFEQMRGNFDKAEIYFKQGLNMSQTLSNGDNNYLAKLTKKTGGFYRILDQNDEAEKLLRKALAMQLRLFDNKSHPDINSTKRELAALLRDMGKFKESKTLYNEVIESRTKILGENHPELGNTWNSYSLLLDKMNDIEGELEANKKFISIITKAYSQPTPSLATAYHNQASTFRKKGELVEALKYFTLSIETQNKIPLPENHVNRSYPLEGIAGIYLQQKKYSEAEQGFRNILSLRRNSLPEQHKTVIDAKISLGEALTGLKRFSEAEKWLLEGYDHSLEKRGKKSRRTKRALRRLVQLYVDSQNNEKTRKYRQLMKDNNISN